MRRVFRHLAAASSLTALVLVGYHLAVGSSSAVASVGDDGSPGGFGALFRDMTSMGLGYDLSALRNLQKVDALVEQQYVDPERIDYLKMFRSSLAALERMIPDVLLGLDAKGERLEVEVGTYHTTLQIQKLDSSNKMEAEFRRVTSILQEHLDPKEVKLQEVEYTIINGVLSTLDPHSVFLPPEGSRKMEEDNEGEFGGLGISINVKDGQLNIDYPMEGTPAWKAGLQSDDKIVKIEGEGTMNMDLDDAVSKMRGPAGSKVTISIMREGFDAPHDYTLVRAVIKPSQVWGQLLEGNIAYIRIDQFHAQVEAQLDETLVKLGKEAGGTLKGVVLDLRDNPGGYLHQAVAVVDRFISEGVIVSTVERGGRNREEKLAQATGTEPSYPMVVLMSGTSASASEIVAGALKNNERAAIVGERSFGKGSVQNLYPFSDESRLKMTIARYLTPGDHSIQSVGIPADIELNASVVLPPRTVQEYNTTGNERISMFHRDRYIEEADLEGALQRTEDMGTGPLYSLRYLSPDPGEGPRTDRPDVRKDFEVMLARDLLTAAKGGRRADVLKDAERVVNARIKTENTNIEQAFAKMGIDWRACTNPTAADVKMEMSVLGDGALDVDGMEQIRFTVSNHGSTPLCQTVLKTVSGNDFINSAELYLGRIDPGKSVSKDYKLDLADGYPSEIAGVKLNLSDLTGAVMASTDLEVQSKGTPLPRYGWSWTFSDGPGVDGKPGGNGNGIAEPGETITLNVDVVNVGEGVGGELSVALKKDGMLGKAVELQTGTFTVKALAPGAHATGTLAFRYISVPTQMSDLAFDLRLLDSKRYDYAAILKASFSNYFTETETLHIPFGAAMGSGSRETPAIQLTRVPELRMTEDKATLSGVATDDMGIRDVILYQGDKKIAYFDGGSGLKSVPFSVTADLAEGNNLLVVLVRDTNGLTTTRSVDIYRPPVAKAQ